MASPVMGLVPTSPLILEAYTSVMPELVRMAKLPAAPRFTGATEPSPQPATDPSPAAKILGTTGAGARSTRGGVPAIRTEAVVGRTLRGTFGWTTGDPLRGRAAAPCALSSITDAVALTLRWPDSAGTSRAPAASSAVNAMGTMALVRRTDSPRISQHSEPLAVEHPELLRPVGTRTGRLPAPDRMLPVPRASQGGTRASDQDGPHPGRAQSARFPRAPGG